MYIIPSYLALFYNNRQNKYTFFDFSFCGIDPTIHKLIREYAKADMKINGHICFLTCCLMIYLCRLMVTEQTVF